MSRVRVDQRRRDSASAEPDLVGCRGLGANGSQADGSDAIGFYGTVQVTLSGDTRCDFDFDVVRVTGTVTDENGVPVPGASMGVTAAGYGSRNGALYSDSFNNADSAVSDDQGRYELTLIAGDMPDPVFTIDPQVDGFPPQSLSKSVVGDLSQTVILTRRISDVAERDGGSTGSAGHAAAADGAAGAGSHLQRGGGSCSAAAGGPGDHGWLLAILFALIARRRRTG